MKTLFLLNHPSHYRKSIYKLIESNINCDFAFGYLKKGNIKSIEKSEFKNPFMNLRTFNLFLGLYQVITFKFSGKYKNRLTGEFKSLSSCHSFKFNIP